MNQIDSDLYGEHFNKLDLKTIYSIAKTKSDPLFKVMILNNSRFTMEIDSGAAQTVISLIDYEKHFPNISLKQVRDQSLYVVTGSQINVVGVLHVNVSHENNAENFVAQLSITVIRTSKNFTPLMGRNWIDILYNK